MGPVDQAQGSQDKDAKKTDDDQAPKDDKDKADEAVPVADEQEQLPNTGLPVGGRGSVSR